MTFKKIIATNFEEIKNVRLVCSKCGEAMMITSDTQQNDIKRCPAYHIDFSSDVVHYAIEFKLFSGQYRELIRQMRNGAEIWLESEE